MDVETTEASDFDEGATYKGTVKKFKANQFLFITPNDDLSAVGVKNEKVEASVSDVNTNQSPVYIADGTEVEFRLRKDEYGVFAYFVSGANGRKIRNTGDVPEKKMDGERKDLNGGQTYQGKVNVFQWHAGFGFVTLDDGDAFEMPAEDFPGKAKFEKSKKLWFSRDDINSKDPAVGLDKDQEVQFTIYSDDKGVGAQNICSVGGAPIKGARNNLRRKPKQKKKKKRKAEQAMGGMAQIVMMNGIPYMMVPCGGGGGGQGAKKKRKGNDGYRHRVGDWKCPECDYNNWNRREVCNECEKGKRPADIEVLDPEQPAEFVAKEGDWKCKCGFNNFEWREECKECSEAKPGANQTTL